MANYHNRMDYKYGGVPGYGGGGGGGSVNTVTGFWDRNASTAGMPGFRYENGQYIDNATSNTVPYRLNKNVILSQTTAYVVKKN